MGQGGKRPGAGMKPGQSTIKNSELRFDLLNTLREKGFEPVAALVEIHHDARKMYKKKLEDNPGSGFGSQGFMLIAQKSAEQIMEYVYPKRKSVELTGQDGSDLFQSFTDAIKQIASEK